MISHSFFVLYCTGRVAVGDLGGAQTPVYQRHAKRACPENGEAPFCNVLM